jgi:hypothetical protein
MAIYGNTYRLFGWMMFPLEQPITTTSATYRPRIYGRNIFCRAVPQIRTFPSWNAGMKGGDGVSMREWYEVSFRGAGCGCRTEEL